MNQWEGRVIRVQRRGVSEQVMHGLITVLPRLRLPTTLLVPYAILLVPTISEVVALISSTDRCAVSVGIGVAVGIVWAGVAAVFTYVGLTCVAVSDGRFVLESRAPIIMMSKSTSRVERALRWWVRANSQWSVRVAARPMAAGQCWALERMVYPLVEPHRLRWYFVVEWLLAFAGGAVLGVAAAADGASACDAAVWGSACIVGLGALEVVMAVALRPFAVRADFALTVAMATCDVAAVAAALANGGADDTTSTAFALMSSVLQLLSLVMSVVYEILKWVGLVTSLGERAQLTTIHHATTNATKRLCNRSVVMIEHSKPSATIVTNAQREHLKELVQVICRRPPVI